MEVKLFTRIARVWSDGLFTIPVHSDFECCGCPVFNSYGLLLGVRLPLPVVNLYGHRVRSFERPGRSMATSDSFRAFVR